MSTQVEPQSVKSEGQKHCPFRQNCPPKHCKSDEKSIQVKMKEIYQKIKNANTHRGTASSAIIGVISGVNAGRATKCFAVGTDADAFSILTSLPTNALQNSAIIAVRISVNTGSVTKFSTVRADTIAVLTSLPTNALQK
ncbi:12532_t:CDS:2 [Acaulospora colombiana]|uniref:12532_t:CDS:1 n=1 Tax=Acaulospora colombiana TaxID=27376 RepID=A0ACA9K402_9GLOM|nr:12532_t:CDS:2 [Acaulospora colombiana]